MTKEQTMLASSLAACHQRIENAWLLPAEKYSALPADADADAYNNADKTITTSHPNQ